MSGVLSVPTTVSSHAAASAPAATVKAAGGGIPNNAPAESKPAERSPDQKARDEQYKAIRASHRFDSFAPDRAGNTAKWYADGHDFMWAISEVIDGATQQICILDWWLSPELYLRRPPEQFQDWRLDRLLLKKATQGVKVRIIVYKEVVGTSPLDSEYTKHTLEALHPNIAVMRHPDHNPLSAEDTLFWSHHEKVVLVDNNYVSMGGLDLCFGRWDTSDHSLADAHPAEFDRTLFSGQDYNNSRILDFQTVDHFVLNQLSTVETGTWIAEGFVNLLTTNLHDALHKIARMPWHDTSIILIGPSVLDAAQHFVERWNYIKTEKYANDSHYDWLALPQPVKTTSNFRAFGANPSRFLKTHPMWKEWQAKGKQYLDRALGIVKGHSRESSRARGQPRESDMLGSTCTVQVCRSVSTWSHDVPTEQSIQNAYISLIHDAKHFIYLENQFFISSTATGGPVVNQIAAAIVERIVRAAKAGEKFKVMIIIPELPAFPGTVKDTDTIKIIMGAQWRTMNRGGASIMEMVKKAGYDPYVHSVILPVYLVIGRRVQFSYRTAYIAFYHARSYDRINGPASILQKLATQTGISYDQAQAALARVWLGDNRTPRQGQADEADKDMTLTIQRPQTSSKGMATQPGSGAGIGIGIPKPATGAEPGGGGKTELPIPSTVAAAMEILKKFQDASTPADKAVHDSVAAHALQDNTTLQSETWVGTEDEKKDCYVTELTYIHSKIMIVDDLRVIIGSANLNDRSMKGDGDSEIAVVVEDTDMIASRMNGQPYQAARFAATFRRRLFKEHLGLLKSQSVDPATAANVDSYMTPVPNAPVDSTQSPEDGLVEDPVSDQFQTLWNETARKNTEILLNIFKTVPNNLVKSWKEYDAYIPSVQTGHVATDLTPAQVTEQLSQIRGHLVQGANDFLIEEDDLVSGIFWSTWNPLLPLWV